MIQINKSELENRIIEDYRKFIETFGEEKTEHECYFKKTINGEIYEINIHYNSILNPAYTNEDIQIISETYNDYVDFEFIKENFYKNSIPLYSRIEKIRRSYIDSMKDDIENTNRWLNANYR